MVRRRPSRNWVLERKPKNSAALCVSKHRLGCPILGITPDLRALRRMALYYGVIPVLASPVQYTQQLIDLAQKDILDRQIAKAGEKIIVVCGRPLGSSGKTNTLIVHTIA